MAYKVIDVSYHNGKIDWETVKNHIDGAILRCGYGDNITSQDDKQWHRNADECTRLGIPFGVYLYSYATSIAQAKSEAEHVLRLIKGYKLSYPVYYDLEEPGTEAAAVQNALTFCEIVERAGYQVGIYANNHWFNTIIGHSLDKYTKWIARYSTLKPDQICDMWQYTADGSVPGISGRVDVNHCYRKFTVNTGSSAGGKKSLDQIVQEVLEGKWGNGADRKKRLQGAGYNYDTVQDAVNKRYNAPSYYKAFSAVSIVDGLRSIGIDNSMSNRKRIAAANGISGYTGTAAQNCKLLSLARVGRLKKA